MKRTVIFLPFCEIGNIILEKLFLQLHSVFNLGEILQIIIVSDGLVALHFINHLNFNFSLGFQCWWTSVNNFWNFLNFVNAFQVDIKENHHDRNYDIWQKERPTFHPTTGLVYFRDWPIPTFNLLSLSTAVLPWFLISLVTHLHEKK